MKQALNGRNINSECDVSLGVWDVVPVKRPVRTAGCSVNQAHFDEMGYSMP